MVVKWSSRALSGFEQVIKWYRFNMSARSADKFKTTIMSITDCLASQPLMGMVDEDFSRIGKETRSIVVKEYHKIVYIVDGDNILISTIWDCRRDKTEIKGEYNDI